MTAATTMTAPARGARPRGLTWVLFRLHRSALWFWVMLLAVAAGALLWAYGPGAHDALVEYREMDCAAPGPSLSCDYTGPAHQRYNTLMAVGAGLINIVPFLTAAWAGGALIGRELEDGTARLAWTQSVTPVRWLAAKLAVPAALIVSGTIALTLLHRLAWAAEGPQLRELDWYDPYDSAPYLANGTLAPAYALLGLALGILAGLAVRRALPALATAVMSLIVVSYGLSTLRPHLWPVRTLTDRGEYPSIVGMFVDEGALTSTGARVEDPICVDDLTCLADHDVVGFYRDYHPASHFWPLQLMETGVVLAVTALAVLAAFRLLRRRTA
ncbi:ABC transporter permease [Streptomyces spinoverrucosus]|uniref:ABC transporter permease n=1 Tax=Streptomyces spinoverrucosus TaxID=284043 RepID=UPI0018C3B57A|nr:ABC transporter permease [Streptomyces spinoverrucosus]MBG0854241.1 ABC transporter permease [Streptomyces spinoverrucosus]